MSVSRAQVEASVKHIKEYVKPYQELFSRREQGEHFNTMVQGLSSDLERKSVEPIAVYFGQERRPLQGFVGISAWEDAPLREQELKEVDEALGVDDGELIVDGSGVPKKGDATVGVARQWCGHLGKVDNCVIGVHAVYVGKDEQAVLVGSELYLPKKWLANKDNRERTHVPPEVTYRTQPEIALAIVQELAPSLRFQWVLGDDEFGRSQAMRDGVRALERHSCFDVPCNTMIRRMRSGGTTILVEQRAEAVADALPSSRWHQLKVADGEKGPMVWRAAMQVVFTRGADGSLRRERLLVMERPDGTERRYCLCHTPENITLVQLARHALHRHLVEEVLEECKGELGMDHFEVRAYHGWHHHMTLVQIAHWFLVREQRYLGRKNSPGITVAMIRAIIGKLLPPPPTAQRVADIVNYQMERNEQSRKAAYAARGLTAPPRRWELQGAIP